MGFEAMFNALPQFKEAYPEGTKAVVNVTFGPKGSFAFVRLLDPVLASTACQLGSVEIRRRGHRVSRPNSYTMSTWI